MVRNFSAKRHSPTHAVAHTYTRMHTNGYALVTAGYKIDIFIPMNNYVYKYWYQ